MQQARAAWLDRLAPCGRVLSAGEGHGRFAEAFARRYPGKPLVCLDACEPMMAKARRRVLRAVGPAAGVTWLHSKLPDWEPPVGAFDAIVTCFFLDCFSPDQLVRIVEVLARAAAPGAIWVNTDFAVPASGPARWRALGVHWLLYAFFRFTTGLQARVLTPADAALGACGFRLAARRKLDWGLMHADFWVRP